MRNLFVILFALYSSLAFGLPSEEDLRAIKLPLVHVVTTDSVDPSFEVVSPPEGCFGSSITNNEYEKGRIYITLGDSLIYDSGDFFKDSTGCKIRVRGNGSALDVRPSYKIKLEKKANLFTGKDVKKNKDFLLLNYFSSRTFNRPIGNCVGKLCGLPWIPEYQFVNVMVNGTYHGLYLLSEMVEYGNLKHEVSKSGYILNNDAYWWNETDSTFQTSLLNKAMGWTFKYPEMEDLDSTRFSYIKNYIEGFEQEIMANGDLSKWIDIESFACWVLAHDILGTFDSGGSNMYVLKGDTTEQTKLKMGPLWDLDTSLHIWQLKYKWSRIHSDRCFYYVDLFKFPEFVSAYINKWNEIKDTIEGECLQVADSLYENYGTAIVQSRRYVYEINKKSYNTAYEDKYAVKRWFSVHLPWMREEIEMMENPLTTGNEQILSGLKSEDRVYVLDIYGRVCKIVRPDELSLLFDSYFPKGHYIICHCDKNGQIVKTEKVMIE